MSLFLPQTLFTSILPRTLERDFKHKKKLTKFGVNHCRLDKHCKIFSRTRRQSLHKNNIFVGRFWTKNFIHSRSRRCVASSAVSPTKKCKSSCWIFKDFCGEDEKMIFCRSFCFFPALVNSLREFWVRAKKLRTRDLNARPARKPLSSV